MIVPLKPLVPTLREDIHASVTLGPLEMVPAVKVSQNHDHTLVYTCYMSAWDH